jgi:deazaflavin-dependent oxidoreductase (nitroreductase family)
MGWLKDGAQADFCYLTTRGRKTGRPHRIEIWFAVADGRLYMLAGGRDSADWVRNVQATPDVEVELNGQRHAGRGRVIVEGDAEDRLARHLLAAKYQGWREGQPLSEWARTALPVAVDFP